MSKFLGFLLGIAVALVGPAMFGVLAADGGIKLNAKEMALAYGIGALIFWTVASYFSGAAALGAALTFGAMIYAVHWIPNRLTNFLNDVPGVTTGMIDGIKQYTLNGVVPILAVISLVFGIQSIVRSVQRRRRERAEADRLQREQEAAVQAQQMPEPVAAYPVAGGDYQPDNRFGNNFGNSNYDDLFEEEPEPTPTPFAPRNQADEQTAQFEPGTTAMEYPEDERDEPRENENERADETMLVPTDGDETALVPTADNTVADGSDADETAVATPPQATASRPENAPTQQVPAAEPEAPKPTTPQAATQPVPAPEPEATQPAQAPEPDATQAVPVATQPAPEPQATQVVPVATQPAPEPEATQAVPVATRPAPEPEAARPVPVSEPEATQPVPPPEPEATQSVPMPEPEPEATQPEPVPEPEAAQPVPVPEEETPRHVAPRVAGGVAEGDSPQAGGPQGGATPGSAPQGGVAPGSAPQGGVAPGGVSSPQGGAPGAASRVDDGGEATQAVPVARPEASRPAAPQAGLQRKEEMGQQYRERMDPPDVDDTGEFFVGAFENPGEQTQPMMELPGRFRPAGT